MMIQPRPCVGRSSSVLPGASLARGQGFSGSTCAGGFSGWDGGGFDGEGAFDGLIGDGEVAGVGFGDGFLGVCGSVMVFLGHKERVGWELVGNFHCTLTL
jgi:hypothetical protein